MHRHCRDRQKIIDGGTKKTWLCLQGWDCVNLVKLPCIKFHDEQIGGKVYFVVKGKNEAGEISCRHTTYDHPVFMQERDAS